MVFVPQPTQNGNYRIKLATSDLLVELSQGKVVLGQPDRSKKTQIWTITRVSSNSWKITSVEDGSVLATSTRNALVITANATTSWSFEDKNGKSTINLSDNPYYLIISETSPNLALSGKDNWSAQKEFVFEQALDNNPGTGGGSGGNTGGGVGATGGEGKRNKSFHERFFTLTPEVAAQEEYDIIIIGTGIGGGVLAADLFDTNSKIGLQAKKILVIERGGLVFHSHCLNASRPSGLGEDRGQQNDTFFASFKDEYINAEKSAGGPEHWKGGPMYCLGGRSAAWGLFSPRVHDKTLDKYFPEKVVQEILKEYYEKAELLMKLSLPLTKPEHQYLIDRLNIMAEDGANVQWQWGRIASEFSDARNYDFAEGAYSTIDRLLEIAMSKPVDPKDGKEKEHKNFKILLNVEARTIIWGSDRTTAVGVSARTATGGNVVFKLQPQGRVILSAGSVDSPAILLRSGVPLRDMGGGCLTDHDIIFRARSFRYRNPDDRQKVGAVKLQTYASIGDNDIALVNMSIDASTFLPRSKNPYDDLPKWIMVFILRAPLMEENDVQLNSSGDPVVTITRSQHDSSKTRAKKDKVMEQLTEDSMRAIGEALKVDFITEPEDGTYFKKLQLGGVAHELGTIPMKRQNGKACLDNDLKLNNYNGVYVCDLSVFPFSPEANPTLTLAALAIRLSRTLVPRLNIHIRDADTVDVVNHSGRDVQVFLSNQAGVPGRNEPVALGPGECKEWQRKNGTAESVFVYRINPRYDPIKRPQEPKFWNIPELLVGQPGQVLPIL